MSEHREIARAKINLNLKILGKREDGFHALETRMAPISLADQLTFTPSEEYSLECDQAGVPLDESNLVTMAVRIFQRETGKACAFRVQLEKLVPHGAGLGGGSSDAAATLRALNQLEGTNLSVDVLAEWAGEIGSDVPFFVYDSVCDCSGRGEIVQPIEWPYLLDALLLKPSFGVSTPAAYKNWLTSEEISGVHYAAQSMSWAEFCNDLERPVFQKHRFLAEMKMWLLQQQEVAAAMMSGSGSTMIAVLHDPLKAEDLKQRAKDQLDPTLWLLP
ncbi:4-(cytidine 5'-diphospho)-2-C-methyl-D-erythritol kinase [Rubritalea profundi]|uniref:4-diphosphocytidyl-2-C-methyl-D-erythritol kinase n=1 Tax=Rubritalea profundi TaxID=1658618 RepID=A0A2S7TXU7_9BACT|nr:4-(cytidine 5'-diphospho)-2-C-methyl-D-erythritol kinase [Rubritalea profundi]PQJ27549.1 4-(cytidine 5'-diphospho)-2-C-methyl-D-erythritol kinase [Rubritalea profundi]